MRRFGRYLAIALINILVFLVLLEVAGVVAYYFKESRFFYGRPRLEASSSQATELRTDSPPATRYMLHPILGFIGRPGTPVKGIVSRDQLDRMAGYGSAPEWSILKSNNFGFFSAHDYPYTPADKPFLIGVFGGSVAQWFALQGAAALTDRLRQLPGLKARRIEVLNFGQGAFKQPQQLQALAYFLATGQPLDFVVNIDGFNDVALSLINVERGIDPSQPSAQQLLPLVSLSGSNSLSAEQIETFAQAQRGERWMRTVDDRMARTSSGGVWLALVLVRSFAENSYRTANSEIASDIQTEQGLMFVNRWPVSGKREDSLEVITSTWMQSSLLMDSMLCAQAISYLQVLQPNQYYSRKQFSDAERRVAISSGSPFAGPVQEGYPLLLARIPGMRSRGVNVVNAVGIFDQMQQAVYADNCCHLNQLGNEVLARFIGDRMAEALASPREQGSCAPSSRP